MSGLSSGNHQLQVYKPKQYINPSTNAISERLVPIYSGNIFLAEKQSTNCTINEFHEKVIILKSR